MREYDKNSLISVIVAVYNIESYIERCITSIIQQSYQNLEIILVDDGSTDQSGTICDRYAKIDSRITVIHKKNGGLSDARNKGTDIATGEFITYVDGDDWIDRTMYEDMMLEIKRNQADIAICRYRLIYPDHTEDFSTNKITVFDGRDALRALIEEDERFCIMNAAWNKLYRRSYTNDLRFPTGKLFEDIVYTVKLLNKVNRTVYLDQAYYNYLQQREGSILNNCSMKKILSDRLPAYLEKSSYLNDIGESELSIIHRYNMCKRMLLMYTAFSRSRGSARGATKSEKKELRKRILEQREYFDTIYSCKIAKKNEKIKMQIFICSSFLYLVAMYLNDNIIVPYKQKKSTRKKVKSLHVVRLSGGLGNQMFQYALYAELIARGKDARLEDKSSYETHTNRDNQLVKAFHLNYKRPSAKELELLTDSNLSIFNRIRRKVFGRHRNAFVESQFNFDERLFEQKKACYEGCFQSEKYFTDVKRQLVKDFTFRCELPDNNQSVLSHISEVNAVSMHIRRGDYLTPEHQKMYGDICTMDYYQHAMAYMKENVPNPIFFVFTNDPEWAKITLNDENIEVVDCNDEATGYLDMYLMSMCKHHIIANSSFSWWGAWLNHNPDKIIIAPSRWLNDRDCSDIYTNEMIIM